MVLDHVKPDGLLIEVGVAQSPICVCNEIGKPLVVAAVLRNACRSSASGSKSRLYIQVAQGSFFKRWK